MGYLTQANIGGSDYKLAGALFGTCTTAAATATKDVTCADFDGLEDGVTIQVYFSNAQTATPPVSLNVNSSGAKTIHLHSGIGGGAWKAEQMVSFTYYNNEWHQNDQTISTDTKNTAGSTNSTSKLYLIGATSQAANPQTYSNSAVYATNGALVANTFNGYALAAACAKGVDTNIDAGSTSTNLPTSAAVAAYVTAQMGDIAGALVYKGTASTAAAISGTSYKKGWYWIAADTFALTSSINVEPGDMIIAKQDKTSTFANDIDVVQTNIDTLTTTEIDNLWAAA